MTVASTAHAQIVIRFYSRTFSARSTYVYVRTYVYIYICSYTHAFSSDTKFRVDIFTLMCILELKKYATFKTIFELQLQNPSS